MLKEGPIRRAQPPAPPPPFEIREAFWGYVVRGTDGPPLMLQVAQGTVLGFGAAFTAAALVLVMGDVGNETMAPALPWCCRPSRFS